MNCKQKNTLSSENRGKTHLKLSLACDRKGTGFQRRFKEIASFEGGIGAGPFLPSWPSTSAEEIRSSEFRLFFEKVWTRSDSKSNKPTDKSQHQKRSFGVS